ncbi:MAG: hypothetical protein V4634_21775 [Pseudomonadota bacterium]
MQNTTRKLPSWKNLPLVAAMLIVGAQAVSAKDLPCTPQAQIALSNITSRIILVGELHGTNEIPGFVSGLACSILREGKPLIVGLESPASNQLALNAYMDSDGGEAARAALKSSKFGEMNDGRSSRAIFGLVESMRQLRRAGANVAVAGIDISEGAVPEPLFKGEPVWRGERDAVMAHNIESRARVNKDHTILVLAGSLHVSRLKGAPWNPDYEPTGYLLQQRLPLYSIAFAFPSGGSYWMCRRVSGSGPVPQDADLVCGMNTASQGQARIDDGDFNTWVSLGMVSASVPMRE